MTIDLYRDEETDKLEDLELITAVLDEMSSDSPDHQCRPDWVTTVSWVALNECWGIGGEMDVNFVHANDLVGDTRLRPDDTRKVMGFKDDVAGRESLDILNGWIGLAGVWKHDPATRTYQPYQLGPSAHAVDVSDPMELRNALDDFALRHGIKTNDKSGFDL
jgi:hypothetical protein